MSAEVIKELVVKYGIDADTAALEQFDDAIEKLKGGLLGLGASVLASAGSLFGLAEHAASIADETEKMSQRLGIGVERLQELGFRAKLADIDMETLGMGLTLLNRNMIEATKGSKDAYMAFSKVGVSVQGVANGSVKTDDVLGKIAEKFAKMPDGPKKTALAMELFGRSGAQFIPFLNGFTTALTENQKAIMEMSILTEEQVKQGAALDDSLKLLRAAGAAFAKMLGASLFPIVTQLVDGITDFIVQNRELIKTNLLDFVRGLSDALKVTWKFVTVLTQSFMGYVKVMGGAGDAIKYLLIGIAAIGSLSILSGIGGLVSAVYALVAAFTLADLAAFAIPIAIGAAVAAIFLVIDDLIAFFNGDDSVTAVIVQKFMEMVAWFEQAFPNLSAFLIGVWKLISAGIGAEVAYLKFLFNGLVEAGKFVGSILSPIFSFWADVLGVVVDKAGQLVGYLARIGGNVLGAAGAGASYVADKINSVTGASPGLSPSAANAAGGAGSVLQQNQISFNVPPGTDPTQVGPFVERGLTNSLDPAVRAALRAGASGVQQ